MTYSEFRYSLLGNLFPTAPGTVVINYNTVGGVTTIDDVAIVIKDDLPQLQEATSISLLIPESNGGIININVESSTTPVRVVDRGVVGVYYCYSILTPDQRPIVNTLPATDPEDYNTGVVIEPITATGAYNYNTYNPLIGNTITDRESSYIVHSDRGNTSTNPANLDSILSDQAVHASVQDSLYSNTGWINGRYEGTKTDAQGYGGINPTITGISFTGAYYPLRVEDNTISQASLDTRVLQEFFFIPGKGVNVTVPTVTVPSDSSAPPAVYEASGQTSATRTVFDFEVTSGATEGAPIQVGSYMYIYNLDEIVRVEEVETVGAVVNTTVKRNMFGTNPNPTTSVVTTTARVMEEISRIYQFRNNRIEFVEEGKVWVQTSEDILRMDESGYSATGSVAL